MLCSKCGNDFDGNFCSQCGEPAPQEVTCQECGASFTGIFCPSCGAKYVEPIEIQCQHLRDKNGNWIDPARLLGAFPFDLGLKSYFSKCTNYSKEEIRAFIMYLRENIQGNTYGAGYLVESQKLMSAGSKNAPLKESKEITRERILKNKQDAVACCPKCGSTSLSASKQGFGIGKAVVGASLVGGIGLTAGNVGSKKLWVTCLNCGNRWKI